VRGRQPAGAKVFRVTGGNPFHHNRPAKSAPGGGEGGGQDGSLVRQRHLRQPQTHAMMAIRLKPHASPNAMGTGSA
jgi:hypothetical protein